MSCKMYKSILIKTIRYNKTEYFFNSQIFITTNNNINYNANYVSTKRTIYVFTEHKEPMYLSTKKDLIKSYNTKERVREEKEKIEKVLF